MKCVRWEPWEDELVRKHYPDYSALTLTMPHRTKAALKSRARDLDLQKKQHRWTGAALGKLRKAYAAKYTMLQMKSIFPGVSKRQIENALHFHKIYVPQGPTRARFRHPAVHALRSRSLSSGLSLRDLRRAIGAHRGFATTEKATTLSLIAKAVDYLGGELAIEWDDLD